MIFGDASIMIQNMFGIAPKAFDPIDMIFDFPPAHEHFGMVDRMMFAIPFQGAIPPKGIGVIHRPFSRFGLDMAHEFVGTDRFDHFGVNAVFPLQEPKHDAFTSRRSPTFSLSFAPKVRFIQLNLPLEFAALQLGQMVQRFSQALIHPSDDFDIDPQVLGQPIGRLQLVEALENHHLPSQTTQTFALPTELTFHVPATGMDNLKGSTKNTLPAPQKVGRTTKNRVSSSNHAPVLAHTGYVSP
jgi:hypothetical protein